MRCPKCGEPMPEGVKFCTECGARMPVQPDVPLNQPCTPSYQQPPAPTYTQQTYAAQPPQSTVTDQPKMKWFKFLINFALWVGALDSLWSAYQLLSGSIYDGYAETVYAYFPGMSACDKVLGVFSIACAVFMIYTRFQLARFRKNGPTCLYVAYIAKDLMLLIYGVVASALIGTWALDADTLISFLASVVVLIINISYFKKRSYLFVN